MSKESIVYLIKPMTVYNKTDFIHFCNYFLFKNVIYKLNKYTNKKNEIYFKDTFDLVK